MDAHIEEALDVSYEELADLEQEFDNVENEIIRQQYVMSKPLYAKRAELVSKIPNFWPLVLEQAPLDIDESMQPSDSALLLTSLKNVSVSRFELDEDEKKGDPRSIAIRFEFAENDHFEDKVLEKKFWFRQSKDGFHGLVSEPVDIKWKKGKDLTDGMLTLVKSVYDEQKAKPKQDKKQKVKLTEKQKALQAKIDETSMGAVSFFAWFGYIGEYVTAEESKEAAAEEKEQWRKRKAGEPIEEKEEDWEEEDDEEDDDLEIFPMGDSIAMAFADDIWPGALKYFIQAQEDDLSEIDFESGDEDEDEEMDDAPAKSSKKHKACAHGCKH
ncbi:hypothetical protein N0V88_002310 [Collariella sp. IMI 366227]|nr:hypothetical protein N0V88_002310 [Collariella sp. IMI 366227]